MLWTLNLLDAGGRAISETYGNGLWLQNAHHPLTGLPETRRSGTGGSENNVQDLLCAWDAAGNLTARQDLRQGLVESFTHDALNRLISTSPSRSGEPGEGGLPQAATLRLTIPRPRLTIRPRVVDKVNMSAVRDRGEAVRRFVIEHLDAHPGDIVRFAAEEFGCSRQAIHKHLQRLIGEGAVTEAGQTRSKEYRLAALVQWEKACPLQQGLAEDAVWRTDVAPSLEKLPKNVLDIWHYGFTEMFNNVIDHSGATMVSIALEKTAAATRMRIYDNGVGIFKKIQAAMNLLDERHAVLELAKGKFTTDPTNHSGEGIFFTSRMFDRFMILSGEVYFSHEFEEREDWILQSSPSGGGTLVRMELHNHTARSTRKVFDKFTSDDDYGFTKTVVPVKLMHYGDDNLVSRSQAKRLLARLDRFKIVILDFAGVASVGQAFADEVFRVFRAKHPEVELVPVHTSSEIKRMISRAEALGLSMTANPQPSEPVDQ